MKGLFVPLLVSAVLLGTTATSIQATDIPVPYAYDEISIALQHARPDTDRVVVRTNRATYEPFTMKSGVPVIAATDTIPIVDAGAANYAVQFPYNVSESTVLRGFTIRGGALAVVNMGGAGKMVDCDILSDGDATDYGINHGGSAAVIDSCTVILDGTGVTSIGISLINSYAVVTNTTVEIRNGTANDWGIYMGSYYTGEPSVSHCFVKAPDGGGIYVQDGTVGYTTVDSTTGYGIEVAGGTAANCIITNASNGYEAGGGGTDFNYCIAYPGGFEYPAGGTGNSEDDPLYCDLAGSTYTLRVDSYGNPENNASGYPIGAYPVACMYGTLQRDAEYAGDGTLEFPGDLTIPTDKLLTLGSGTILDIAVGDSLSSGSSSTQTELIVNGALVVNGAVGDTVRFRSAAASPAEDDWLGVVVANESANVLIEYAEIRNAQYGVACAAADTAITIRHCLFQHNYFNDLQFTGSDTSAAITVADNVIEVGMGTGVKFEKTYGTISGNEITGEGASTRGIYLNLGESQPEIEGNTVSGFSNGYGLDVATGNPVVTGNTFEDNKYGLYIRGGAAEIGVDSTSAANTITGNTRGISTTCTGAGTCPTCSGFNPHVRNCNITENYFGVVTEKRGNLVNLGEGGDRGVNNIYDNTSYCVWNRSVCANDEVWAIGNYWGGCDENDFPVVCWEGDVLTDGYKCSGPDAYHPPMGIVELKPFRVLGVVPNPVTRSAQVQFAIAGEGAQVGVRIFDVTGRLVCTIQEQHVNPGVHELTWDGRTEGGSIAGAGIYFVRVTANNREHETVKVLVLR